MRSRLGLGLLLLLLIGGAASCSGAPSVLRARSGVRAAITDSVTTTRALRQAGLRDANAYFQVIDNRTQVQVWYVDSSTEEQTVALDDQRAARVVWDTLAVRVDVVQVSSHTPAPEFIPGRRFDRASLEQRFGPRRPELDKAVQFDPAALRRRAQSAGAVVLLVVVAARIAVLLVRRRGHRQASSASTAPPSPEPANSRRPAESGRRSACWLVLASWALLASAWVFANPPGTVPDEREHYVKAAAAGHGDLVGRPGPPLKTEFSEIRWVAGQTREMRLPASLHTCRRNKPFPISGSCGSSTVVSSPAGELTYLGYYSPVPYLLPGLAMDRLTASADAALLVGRAVTALVCMTFLAAAALLLRGGAGSVRLTGLVLAVTPGVIFATTGLSDTAVEVGAAICYCACLARLTADVRPSRAVWLVTAISGLALASARPLGPVWVILLAALFAVLPGTGRAWRNVKTAPLRAFGAAVTIAAGVAVNLGWARALDEPRPRPWSAITGIVPAFYGELGRAYDQAIGSFGWIEVSMPHWSYVAWSAALAVVLALALMLGEPRHRIALAVAVAGCVIVGSGLSVTVRGTGLGWEVVGRYLLPVFVAVPMLAGEVLHAQQGRLRASARGLPFAASALVLAVVHVVGWSVNATHWQRDTFGRLPLRWQPVFGWGVWQAIVVLAAVLLTAAGLLALRPAAAGGPSRATDPAPVRG